MTTLKKHQNEEIKKMAKDFVDKWKRELAQPKSGKDVKPAAALPPKVSLERKHSASPAPSTPTPVTPSLRERSYKLDKVTSTSVGDKVRDKTIELFYSAIGLGSDEPTILKKSTEVEAALYKTYGGGSDKYKSQFRTLIANLKDKDPRLRENVLNGTIAPKDLVVMTPDELMPAEVRQLAEEAKRKNLMNSMTAPPQEAETDAFKCGKCQKRKCTYYQKQTRSADEPMTTFVMRKLRP
ncbi:RNA polymerase II elongation factor [Phlyctochytrium bullatum]|nr:RNA polymerase II elongation factor [Phlyctochytrium bullatum]